MARGVEDGEAGFGRLEVVGGDVDGDAAGALVGGLVHDPGEGEGGFAHCLGLLAEFVNGPLVDDLEVEEESAHESAFAVIYVTCVYD